MGRRPAQPRGPTPDHVIDLRRLRDDFEYRRGIERKRVDGALLDRVLEAEDARRVLLSEVEELRARQNAASKEIGRAPAAERDAKIAAATSLKDELAANEPRLAAAEARLHELALQIPNPADASVPDGGEDANEVVRVVGEPSVEPPRDHAEFGTGIGFVEARQAVEMSGSRFVYLMREAALLELALVQWVMTRVVAEGFTPVIPPVLVREHAMEEAGFFPTDRAQVYEVDGGELFLVGTSEVALSALHRGEIVETDALPLRYAGLSTCFRREAGTYGKDTRGIFRVHQFDKAEMFSFARPEQSWVELEAILALQESIVIGLGLPYRVVNCATDELGAAAAKKYDIEVWLPSEGRYRELTSCSNYLDYSARRLGTRFRGDAGMQSVHTLNGTACAVGRTLVFLFEHCQRPDGSFAVPEVLIPLCGFDRVPAHRP
ncbi:MAG TPA: serine--tRNA ligase [Acidimicrobiia bacterium]|nr:serine--tRNA ligase [Acidimicrobiia bacterium]